MSVSRVSEQQTARRGRCRAPLVFKRSPDMDLRKWTYVMRCSSLTVQALYISKCSTRSIQQQQQHSGPQPAKVEMSRPSDPASQLCAALFDGIRGRGHFKVSFNLCYDWSFKSAQSATLWAGTRPRLSSCFFAQTSLKYDLEVPSSRRIACSTYPTLSIKPNLT